MSILIKPIITEKATNDSELYNRFTFVVDKKANKLEINAYNEAEVTLNGSGSHLIANFYGDSDLDADRFEVNVANVLGFDDADMKVNVLDTLYQKTSGDADIDHEGAPVMMPEE